jgi:hypothetical protein
MGLSGQRHAPAALYPRGKDPRYPLDRKLGGPQSRLDAEARRKILCLHRGPNPGRPVRSQTMLSELPRFLPDDQPNLIMETEQVFETFVCNSTMTCLVARDDFTFSKYVAAPK